MVRPDCFQVLGYSIDARKHAAAEHPVGRPTKLVA
jgi:hypothetical protein